jgi:hypothetical protein
VPSPPRNLDSTIRPAPRTRSAAHPAETSPQKVRNSTHQDASADRGVLTQRDDKLQGMNMTPWVAASAAEVRDRARHWLTGDALAELVPQLGGPTRGTEHLTDLRAWSASTLDTRHGAERRDAQKLDLPREALDALVQAAPLLGLARTSPPVRNSYGTIVVLGGATTGNRLRTELAQNALRTVDTRLLVALASDRPISDSELIDEPDSADDGTEWQNLVRNFDRRFGLVATGGSASGIEGLDRCYRTCAGVPLRVLVAPRVGDRRPTTMQQLGFLRDRVADVDRQSVLLVTSAIYAPYQFFAGAPAVLVDGADHAELVGTETVMTGDRRRLAQRVGQEVHAAIEAAIRLIGACQAW